ncbi:carboxypeptidase M32 [Baia soyae]|uniref:Metal-dependent carboxypeptidase n=1 Tax=Baia soyae TaxID=1544746 RepID=A0A4R2RT74_9BACL|nr:carboxypeptidase M32 [Baia soyae]TCP66504.1 carboxypeptidase Taq [Baia soyae]
MNEKLQVLRARLQEIYHLHSAKAILEWDQGTFMPNLGAESRGNQLSVLAGLHHHRQTDPELGRLLEELSAEAESLSYDSDEAALIRVAKQDYDTETKVSPEFVAEFVSHTAKTYSAWVKARKQDDFSIVQPYLEKTLELSRRYAEFFEYEHVADPLIARNDYGMTVGTIRPLFSQLRDALVPMVEAITSKEPTGAFTIKKHYPADKQIEFGKKVITRLGFDWERGRQDYAPHPFMTKFAHNDIRITTRVNENYLGEALFSSIHETGHALYEFGINEAYEGTPLHHGTSSGVHESQSRLWENIVGRSYEFWTFFYPQLQATFPEQLKDVSLDEFYCETNKVSRSLIRTDADEVTYNLHVIIRFDLETQMLEGNLKVKDLPEAWRARYQSDLGISSPTNANGVLQDIHWYFDHIGGLFQGYTLGNILSSQFFAAAEKEIPNVRELMKQGDFTQLHTFLQNNIYTHGRKYTTDELVKRVTGQALSIDPYVEYLQNKFSMIYPQLRK